MIRRIFIVHFLLFIILGALLYASDSLTFNSTLVHWVYAGSIFTIFMGLWWLIARFRIRLLHYLLLFGYYNYLFLIYILFELGKDNLGVPMTFKMIYPYVENYSLLSSLISTSTLVLAGVGYLLVFGIVFYFWNKAYRHVSRSSSILFLRQKITLISIPVVVLLLIFAFNFSYFKEKFNDHKLNEPYLTLLFFDDAFERQKESGDENAAEFQKYTSPKGNGKNVVLIIADALRPDFFQSEEQLTPFIDSLLTKPNFVAHQNIYSTAAFSFNGISSILSSSNILFEKNFFLHDVLKKQGYDINFILSGDFTNFWNLRNHMATASVDYYTDGYESFKYGRSENLNDDEKNILNQLEELEAYKGVPTFFYFHMMSVHQVGDLKEKYNRFQPSSVDLSSSDIDPQLLVNDYKNRMMQLDDNIQKLYTILEKKGYLDDFVFIITGDHGQSLGENGYYFHSKYVNLESIKIPFIINSDKVSDVSKVSSQLDIAPSVLEALELKIPKTWKGTSLSDSIPRTAFQRQGDFYSMIWQEQPKTYQLHWNASKNEYDLFDISADSEDKYTSIITTLEPKKLDSLKQVLKSYYQR